MKNLVFAATILLALASCSTTPVDPIPGSITYGGQPKTKLLKSAVGSTFSHTLTDQYGRSATEIYRVEPDRSLVILRRDSINRDF